MANIYDMADTWNDGLTAFTAIKMNVTDTASAASSMLMDLQVGGSSRFSIAKAGNALNFTDASFGAAAIQAVGARIDFVPAAAGGAAKAAIDFAGRFCAVSTLQIGSIDQANAKVVLARDADDVLAQRRSTNVQTFNIYNTYTDASNYERGFLKWNSNILAIGTEAAGSGTARNMQLQSAGGLNLFSNTGVFKIGGVEGVSSSGTLIFGLTGKIVFGNSVTNYTGQHAAISRAAQNVLAISGESGGGSLQLSEMTAPAGAANTVRIYAEDNGAGKTRLMVQFGTGAAQQIAIEP